MNYHNITVDDMLNGDGLRTVLWVSGCMHPVSYTHLDVYKRQQPVGIHRLGGTLNTGFKHIFQRLARPM